MKITKIGKRVNATICAVILITPAQSLLAGGAVNDFVSCMAPEAGVRKVSPTDFHVDPADEPLDIYFSGVNGWTLLQPPNGLVVLQPFPDRKAWGAKNELKEAFASGFVEHCFFPFRELANTHKTEPTLSLPTACPIEMIVSEQFIEFSSIIAPDVEPGTHDSTREMRNCVCNKPPPSPISVVPDERFPNVFDYTIQVVIVLKNGLVIEYNSRFLDAGNPFNFYNKRSMPVPSEIASAQIFIKVDASDTTCGACSTTCAERYFL